MNLKWGSMIAFLRWLWCLPGSWYPLHIKSYPLDCWGQLKDMAVTVTVTYIGRNPLDVDARPSKNADQNDNDLPCCVKFPHVRSTPKERRQQITVCVGGLTVDCDSIYSYYGRICSIHTIRTNSLYMRYIWQRIPSDWRWIHTDVQRGVANHVHHTRVVAPCGYRTQHRRCFTANELKKPCVLIFFEQAVWSFVNKLTKGSSDTISFVVCHLEINPTMPCRWEGMRPKRHAIVLRYNTTLGDGAFLHLATRWNHSTLPIFSTSRTELFDQPTWWLDNKDWCWQMWIHSVLQVFETNLCMYVCIKCDHIR